MAVTLISRWEGIVMGFWPRGAVTAVVAAAVAAGGWQGIEAIGAGQATAIAVTSIAATVVVTLGAVWVSRARGSDDPDSGGVSAVVSRSASGQVVSQAHGPVFGPGGDFTGATITIGSVAGEPIAESEAGKATASPAPGVAERRVVVGEIPQEPPAFQDHPDLMAALTGPPGNGRVSVVFTVTGLRGVGKSQLAAACARRRLDEGWPVVAWINAEDREEMLAGYAQFAAQLGLAADAPDSAEAARRVRHWLEADGERCLLVLDNGCDADVLRPFLPAAGHAQVIITSSNASLAGLGKGVPVDVFTEEQATAFLAERTGLDDRDGALAVARELGCLPLALAQAGAVIAGQRLDCATYLSRLAKVTLAGYLTRPRADPYPHGTAEAITLALDAALRDDVGGLARRLLATIALLSPTGAPRALVSEAVGSSAGDADAALGQLAAWSLITFSVDGVAVSAHRLVMRVVRERSAANGFLAATAGEVIGTLGAMLPAAEDAWRDPALMREFVTQVTALSDHLDALAELTGDQADRDFLELLNHAGWYLNEISDLSRSIPLIERTLADTERVLGPDHPITLTSRNNLANAYQDAGRLDEAIAMFGQLLVGQQRVLGPDHPRTLTSRNNLADAYRDAGRLDEAIVLFGQVLADTERLLGPDHPSALTSRNNLAGAYLYAGRLDEAIVLFGQVLADTERVLGPDHPSVLTYRRNLAGAYQDAGRLDEAIALFEQVLIGQQRVLSPDHPSTLTSRNILAGAYRAAGRLDQAIALYQQVLADQQRVLGPDHPSTLAIRNNLACAYRAAGRLDEAIALFEQVLTDAARVLGAGHPTTQAIRKNLAAAQAGQRKRRRTRGWSSLIQRV